jgi:GNAT superfamily N-acetyltransferase
MIKFRETSYERDIDEIVRLIQENLDNSYSLSTISWKHLNNPFGKSYSMVAVDNNVIIGVVFYMRYNYKNYNGDIIRCIRPFDGCTAKNYRGKGVFKKLMSNCLDYYKEEYDFLLATPNKKSYPELLKLQWEVPADVRKYQFGIITTRRIKKDILTKEIKFDKSNKYPLSKENYYLAGNSMEYINWRYNSPDYRIRECSAKKTKNYLIYRIIKNKYLKVIVICDYFGHNNCLNDIIKEVCRIEKIYFIYYLNNEINVNIKCLFKFNLKNATYLTKSRNYSIPDNLVITLGDLEGRL